jgi:hypothetical protein
MEAVSQRVTVYLHPAWSTPSGLEQSLSATGHERLASVVPVEAFHLLSGDG